MSWFTFKLDWIITLLFLLDFGIMSVALVGDNWQQAITEDSSSLHILPPLSVSFDVYKCIISDTNLPKY